MANQFVGKEKVVSIVDDGPEKLITLKTGETLRVAEVLLPKIVTDKATDFEGSAKELKYITIADEIMLLLTNAYMVKLGEIETLLAYVQNVTENNYTYATRLIWGRRNKLAAKIGKNGIYLKDLVDIMMEDPKETAQVKTAAKSQANQNLGPNREIRRG